MRDTLHAAYYVWLLSETNMHSRLHTACRPLGSDPPVRMLFAGRRPSQVQGKEPLWVPQHFRLSYWAPLPPAPTPGQGHLIYCCWVQGPHWVQSPSKLWLPGPALLKMTSPHPRRPPAKKMTAEQSYVTTPWKLPKRCDNYGSAVTLSSCQLNPRERPQVHVSQPEA